MWGWHALAEIPPAESEVIPSNGVFDAYHLNAVQVLPENKLFVSMRDMSAVYEIDQSNGSILWTLGGKQNQFKLRSGLQFDFQHDAKLEGNRLTMFDNESGPPLKGFSRGLVLNLNFAAKKVDLVREFARAEKPSPPRREASSDSSIST